MSTNNKISNIVSSQLPSFVRDDHPNFVAFLEAYYEWMEQNGQTLDVTKNIGQYFDVDKSTGVFLEELQKTFLNALPNEVITDKNLFVKHIKDFYRAKGTEKAINFILRILFGADAGNTSFYYPKQDILYPSNYLMFILTDLWYQITKLLKLLLKIH